MAQSDPATPAFDLARRRFLVTGGAGFIGSHIVRSLIDRGAQVRVLDLLSSGRRENLAGVADRVDLMVGDVADPATVRAAVDGAEYVLHLAALVSVPESVERPERNFEVNLAGTQHVLMAARAAGVRRVVFSSTCAVYGDHAPPHHEQLAPRACSPYAAAKLGGEQLCRAFSQVYGLPTVCLRYFNVFGPGQNPRGGYAAAIPLFISALLAGQPPQIFGDGLQTRDFVYVANVVQANLLACVSDQAVGEVFNIGTGQQTNLRELLGLLAGMVGRTVAPAYRAERAGDIRHSYGDISHAAGRLGYQPRVGLAEGLRETLAWYQAHGSSF